jgi:hypothetical protein
MLNSEDEAFRLSGDDRGSWSARGRARKAYRSMPATPDEEVPRHRRSRKNRKKHVHKWGEWQKNGTYKKPVWGHGKIVYVVAPKWYRVCKKCGYKERVPRWYW